MNQGQRVGILIDVQNLFYSARSIMGGKVEYSKLLSGLVGDRILARAIAYVVHRPDIDQTSFYDALVRLGYELRIKEAKNRTDSEGNIVPVKGSYEVMFTLDAMNMAQKVDTVIIASGDGNYTPLITHLKDHGCRVEVASFDGSTNNELIKAADKFVPIKKEWTFSLEKKEGQVLTTPASEEEDEPQPISNSSGLGIFGNK